MSMKRKHEGLSNYLQPIGAPGDVRAVGLQPRQPVGPTGAIPGGFRPIPTSSQGPKRTNATIVYARTAAPDAQTLGRTAVSFTEGDVVFTERFAPPVRSPMGLNVKVVSMQQLNRDIAAAGPMDADAAEAFFMRDGTFKFAPDGIVNNNLDGADPENEFNDFPIANVAIQGFCRFSTLSLPQKSARNGDKVFVVLTETDGPTESQKVFKFKFLLASHVTTGKDDLSTTRFVWRLGRVVDGNQSKNMITVCVGVEPVHVDPDRGWVQLKREWLSGDDAREFEKTENALSSSSAV